MNLLTAPPAPLTAADLIRRFGPILLSRIRFRPVPGTATEQDMIDIYESERRRYELVDGILVEKAMGFRESILASALSRFLWDFLARNDLGIVAGEGGMMRLAPGLIRTPDVSFVSWDRLPNRQVPPEPAPDLMPDLAVEVLSARNTAEEMARKLHDYFNAGCRLVWFVDLLPRTVTIYTALDEFSTLHENDTLDGGAVLPGFALPLRQLFRALDRR